MKDSYLYIFLARGVINDEGFWLIGTKNTESRILDDENLIECHSKELIGFESVNDILDAINLNLENIKRKLEKQNFFFDKPPKGISFNIPLNVLEDIFDFWVEAYKDKEIWETCFSLLKISRRASLINLIKSESVKGDSKKWAIKNNIKSGNDWLLRGSRFHNFLPSTPYRTYKDQWKGWADFLEKEKK